MRGASLVRSLLSLVVLGLAACASGSQGTRALPAARFTAAYQQLNQGRVQFLEPEVYEMINVAIALTTYAGANPGRVYADSDYYQRLEQRFGGFREHALVRQLDAIMQSAPIQGYISVRLSGYAFEFDEHGQVVPSPVYRRIEPDRENPLVELRAELQSFADDTNFRAFYATNHQVYQSQIEFFEDHVDGVAMWSWLRRAFPQVAPYNGVKVLLSPLAGNYQNAVVLEDNGYRELQAHINFPYLTTIQLTAAGLDVWRGTLLFGEMNHGFINPTADRYRDAIDEAILDRSVWASQVSAQAYASDQEVFNEYLNFGLICLYHADQMNAADAVVARQRIEEVMVSARGFSKFREFNAQLTALYQGRGANQTIADLYPQIIAWFGAESRRGVGG